LPGHKWSVTSLAFSHDGKRLLSSGLDDSIRLWNVSDGQLLETFQAEAFEPLSLAWSTNESQVFFGRFDGTVVAAVLTMDSNESASELVLNAALQGTQMRLDWNGAPGNLQVQTCSDLVSGHWQDIPTPAASTNLVIDITSGAQFYRLKRIVAP
jgi:WD40 repeat protein